MMLSASQLVDCFYHEVWNRADEAMARRILSPTFRFRASLGPEKLGPDGFIDYMRAIHSALAGYTCTIQEIVAQDERAAVRLLFAGVHQGLFFGVPATGHKIAWSGSAFFTTAEGQIHSLWVLGDVDAVKRQLGAAAEHNFDPVMPHPLPTV